MAVTENTNRAVFGLHGVTGMLIATVLLLAILVVLTMWGLGVQQKSASNFYDPAPITSNLDNVKANSKDNANFAFQDAK
jgi:succinate dehydrogenase/fumarate reductase cytochrome b subunit